MNNSEPPTTNPNQNQPDQNQPSQTSRVLCVWLPNWPVQRVQAVEPELASRPFILSIRDARRGLTVVAANLAARAAGVRPRMRLSEAAAIVEAEAREHDSQEDIDGLCMLAEQAQQFSPIVGLEQLDKKLWAGRTLHQPECLLLDVTGLASLFGGEAALMAQVSQWLAAQNFFGCMAIADSLGGAWALANYGTRRLPTTGAPNSDQPLTTNTVASVPPCRCYNAAAGDLQSITDLPFGALRIAPETATALHRLGLRRLGELEQLPRAGLATRLGESLLTRLDQVMGVKHEPIVALHALPDWSIEQTLEYPTEHRQTIAELVRRLSRQLADRLARRGEGALRLICRLDLVKRPSLLMQLGLFRPTNDAAHLEMLLAGQLEQQLRTVSIAPLWRLSLQATLTAPIVWRQADLFSGNAAANRNEIARLVDNLSSRLGRKNVLSAKVSREAQPELSSTFQPLTGRRSDGRQQDTVRKLSSRVARNRAEPSREDPLRRPTRLFNPPIAIQVAGVWRPTDAAADTSAGTRQGESKTPAEPSDLHLAAAPAKLKYQEAWHPVAQACGPERLESGWWKGPSVRRDYYRIVTASGSWWWIYRDLNTNAWFLHGMFD